MKVFISQPMRGKTNEEIKAERERLIGKAQEHYGADIEVVDSWKGHPGERPGQLRHTVRRAAAGGTGHDHELAGRHGSQ